MDAPQLDIIVTDKVKFYLDGFVRNATLQNYGTALTHYKMAKCLSANFDHEEPEMWANILYHLGYHFKCRSEVDAAAYCLDRALELCPQWTDAQYARSCIITSSIECNSPESNDQFYANHAVVDYYLCPDRIQFYSDFINACVEHGIVFENKDIVDAGCGPGLLLKMISERAAPGSLAGFDFSSEAIKTAQQRCGSGSFYQADIYAAPHDTFDIVICTETLEHLLYPEKAMMNLLSMTRSRGNLILCVPNGRMDTFEGHINFWSPESWAVFMENTCKGQSHTVMSLNERHLVAMITKTTDSHGCKL